MDPNPPDRPESGPGGRDMPTRFQRVENAAVAVAAAALFIETGFGWWWLAVLFLAFDLSMLGYLAGPRVGAWIYNLAHAYVGPGLLGLVAVVADARWAAFVALLWAFHIGVDRTFGYGLKFPDRFTHTHLGEIGRG